MPVSTGREAAYLNIGFDPMARIRAPQDKPTLGPVLKSEVVVEGLVGGRVAVRSRRDVVVLTTTMPVSIV